MRAKQKFKKGTFSRRVFSVLMALAMVISLMPMNAMEVKAEGATKITSMTLDVDWSKIPTLKEGQSAKSAESALSYQEEPPVTVSGTGMKYFTCGWAVKALQSHVDSEYIQQNNYDESEKYDYWVPLELYRLYGKYTINATDTYAFVIKLFASDGYYFADGNDVDLANIVKGNDVVRTHSFRGGSGAVAFLKLGTVSEIAAKTEGAKPTEHTITATAEENGSISPNGKVQVKEGENQTFTITPNEGYEIDTLTVDGKAVTASTSYTFSKVTAAHTIDVTFKEVHTHTIVTDAAVAPTCTEAGKTEGKHCSVCGEIITPQTTVAALGHDWSNEWVITKLATATTEGKKECKCKREGCNQKKYEVIPVIGTTADPYEGKLDKDAEVAPEAPIKVATIDNTKTELLNAPYIFTADEKQAIEGGAGARVWMEVSKTNVINISSPDMTKISAAATSIMGDNPSITYFDADLFKQVGDGQAEQLYEPGIDIEVTIKVPENLINADSSFEREYKIIRLHKDLATGASLVDILSGTFDKVTGEFTFKTDKFSTYAIAYTDKKVEIPDSDNGGNNGDNTDPGVHTHDWSNDWVVTKPATTITEGKKECKCKRAGCNQKKYEVIPVIGTPADPNEGKLDKDAEVAPEAPIKVATIDNTKTELLNAPYIFTADEKQAIEGGAGARVWMEVSKTNVINISSPDMTKISAAATSIMGDNPSITYFDADLFKQVGDGQAEQLYEPGIDIEVTIKVPENLINADSSFEREYKIIRLHKDLATGASLVDILSGTFDKVTGEFSFKTDKFSTFAIAYTDKKLVTGDSDNGGNNVDNNSGDNNQSNEDANTPANTKEDKKPYVEAPKTGDASNVTLWSLLLALSALALADIRVARRKRSSSIEK